jgi:hypothetical protein
VLGGPDGPVTLCGVMYVPTLNANLLSASKATGAGYSVEMQSQLCEVTQATQKGTVARAVVLRAKKIDGLYVVQGWLDHTKAKVLVTKELIHKRFGHLGQKAQRKVTVTLRRTAQSASRPSRRGLPTSHLKRGPRIQCNLCTQTSSVRLR